MSNNKTIYNYNSLEQVATRFRGDLKDLGWVLLYAYNGTGKTRLSMEFREKGKDREKNTGDTLYFNAYTEDLFTWDNDLDANTERKLMINSQSKFFNGFKELAIEDRIFSYLERYATFTFKIDYNDWFIWFTKDEDEYIKISRGEENLFIWCIFLAICELVIEDAEAYNWVKYIYIDDPISSLDDNNAISVATDLAQIIRKAKEKDVGVVVSSHHHLFYNVMWNELPNKGRFFLHKRDNDKYVLRKIQDTPFFHHISLLAELKIAVESDVVKTYHFNMLRNIMEKTAAFFGHTDFARCIAGIDDEVLYQRALNLLSHGSYSLYEPIDMGDDTKRLFVKVYNAFMDKHDFYLPEILTSENKID